MHSKASSYLDSTVTDNDACSTTHTPRISNDDRFPHVQDEDEASGMDSEDEDDWDMEDDEDSDAD